MHPTWKFIKNSSKNLKKTGKKAILKDYSQENKNMLSERSKSIEQSPTYLENLRPSINTPEGPPSQGNQKLNNFYVVSSHGSHGKKGLIEVGKVGLKQSLGNNDPSIGVEHFGLPHSAARNK